MTDEHSSKNIGDETTHDSDFGELDSLEEGDLEASSDVIGDVFGEGEQDPSAADNEFAPNLLDEGVRSALEKATTAKVGSASSKATEESEAAKAKSREMSLSSFIHLMGLPTANQITVLEAKIDSLTAKVNSLASKFERINQQFQASSNERYLDRIDYQLADLRAIIKKIFPRVAAMEQISDVEQERESSGKMTLTSGQ